MPTPGCTKRSLTALMGWQDLLPGRRHVLLAMMGQVFLIMLGIGLVGPIMPLYAQSFDVGAAAVGGLITSFGLARIVMNVPAGGLAERIGRKPLLIGGPLLTCLAALLTGLATRFDQLIIFRFIQGLGSAAQTTAAMIVLADITTPQERGRAMSLYQGSLLVGQSFGPVLGGFVGEYYGYRVPFFVYSALGLLAAIWALLVVPESKSLAPASQPTRAKRTSGEKAERGALANLLLDLNFLLISLVTITIFFTRTGSRSTVLPLFGYNQLGLSAGQLGFTFTFIALCNLGMVNLCGSLCDRFGRKAVIVPGCLLSGLALFAFSLSRNYVAFLGSAALLGLGTGLAGPAPAAYVADIARPGRYGLTVGVYRTFADMGVSVGPLLLGWISDLHGFMWALWLNAAMFLISGLAFGRFAHETVKRKPKEALVAPAAGPGTAL